jgi:hypothetical protein
MHASASGAHGTLKQFHYARENIPNFCGNVFPFSYLQQKHVNLENISRWLFLIPYAKMSISSKDLVQQVARKVFESASGILYV